MFLQQVVVEYRVSRQPQGVRSDPDDRVSRLQYFFQQRTIWQVTALQSDSLGQVTTVQN
eukprot:m.1659950 g.1659950  ORF g.1659950 m.1659950 type:complete len:59 (+) comp120376_c0_seq1:94-270(+)